MKIQLQIGESPWQATASSTRLVDTYHVHDIPLVGLLEQNGDLYLFRCLTGELEPTNFWCYYLVSSDEVAAIEATSGPEEFDSLVNSFADDRPVALAVAADGFGIIAWIDQDDWGTGDDEAKKAIGYLTQTMRSFLESLDENAEAQTERVLAAI